MHSRSRSLLCGAGGAALKPPLPLAPGSITGVVVDAENGVPIPGVEVGVSGLQVKETTDSSGRFVIHALPVGTYTLTLRHQGYQPAISEAISIATAVVKVTLSMQRGTNDLQVIAVTSARASESLQQSSTFTKTVDTEELQRQGIVRTADALRTLPGVNNGITGDTASLADDIAAEYPRHRNPGDGRRDLRPSDRIRHQGRIQLSALARLSVSRRLGALWFGREATSTSASTRSAAWSTSSRSIRRRSRSFRSRRATARFSNSRPASPEPGTPGHLGYAFAYGTSYLDGPFNNDSFYQTGAAFDQSCFPGRSTTSALRRRLGDLDEGGTLEAAVQLHAAEQPDVHDGHPVALGQ